MTSASLTSPCPTPSLLPSASHPVPPESAGDAPSASDTSQKDSGRTWSPRFVLTLALIGGSATFFVFSRWTDLVASVAVLRSARIGPLVAALVLSTLAVVNRGLLSRAGHRAVGLEADARSMTRVTAAAYALNKVVKTGGVGGITVFVRHGHTRNRAPGRVVAAYVAASLAAQVALVAVVVASIASMTLAGRVTGAWLVGAIGFAAVTVASLGSIAFTLGSPERVRDLYALPQRLGGRLTRHRRSAAPETNDEHIGYFLEAIAAVRARPGVAVPLLGHALAAKLLGASVLMMALAATGSSIGYGSTLTVYALALIAGTASLLPGGIGPVEASMAAVLGIYGVPLPAAIAAVATFRLLDLWFPLLLGLLSARRLPIATSPRPKRSMSTLSPGLDRSQAISTTSMNNG